MSPRSRSVGSRSAGMGGGSYAYDDPNDEDEEDLLDEDDELEELEDEEGDYNGYRTMARMRARGDAHSRSRSRSLSRSRTGRAMAMGRMQPMQSPYARSHQSPYGGRAQSPYAREMVEPEDYDELEDEEEMLSERGRGGVDMYSPRYQSHRYGPRPRYPRMHSPYMAPRYARDDLAMYHDDVTPYGGYSPAAFRPGYPPNYPMDFMPRKYYDDLDVVPWGGMAPSISQAYWTGATPMSMRRVMPTFPGQLPNLKYPTPRAFNLSITSLAGTSGPWFTVIDELGSHRTLYATGACTQGISVIPLASDLSGEVLRLTSCRTGRSVGCADVRIVVNNAFGVPLMTAIVPAVIASCERQQMSNFYNSFGGGGMYGAGYPGALPTSAAAAAAAAAHAAHRGFGTPTMSPYGGMGWYGAAGAGPYGYDDPTGMNPFSSLTEYGAGDPLMGAVFYPGDRGHESPSPYQRRKRAIPAMRLVRSMDGTREWLQSGLGHELAGLAYSTPPGTPAPFSIEGSQIRLIVQPGVDVALVAAALIARLWIYVETGIGQ